MIFFSSYYNKIIILLLCIGLIPVLLLSSYYVLDKISSEIDFLSNNISIITQFGSHDVSNWIEQKQQNVKQLSQNKIIISKTKIMIHSTNQLELFSSKINLQKEFQNAYEIYDDLQEFTIYDLDGNVIFFSGQSTNNNIKNEKYFQDAIKGKISASDIFSSIKPIKNEFGVYDTGVPTMLISAPIKGDVQIEGIITVRVNVFDIAPNLQSFFLNYDSGEYFIVNSKGYLLSESQFPQTIQNMNLIEKRSILELQVIDTTSDVFVEILNNIDHSVTNIDHSVTNMHHSVTNMDHSVTNLDGQNSYHDSLVIRSISPIHGTNWYSVVEIDKNEAFFDINQLQIVLISFICILSLSVVSIAIYFSSHLILPLQILKQSIEKIKEENLDVQMPVTDNKELNELSTSFQSLINWLKTSKELHFNTEAKYKNLYEKSPGLHRTINQDGIILDCNESYAKRFEYTKDEIIGSSIYKFISEKNHNELTKSFQKWVKDGIVSNHEVLFKTKSGKEFPALISANNIYDIKHNLIGSNTIIRDISGIRKIAKTKAERDFLKNEIIHMQKVEKQKNEFSSMVSHELKTPLTSVRGYSEILLEDKTLTDVQRECITEIKESSESLEQLINNLLDVNKLALGKMTFKKEDIDLDILVNSIVNQYQTIYKKNSINFIASSEELTFHSDKLKLHQVLNNLIKNAMDFVPEDGIIKIGAKIQDEFIIFYVEDNGIGIVKKNQDKIFQKFYQIDTSATRKHGGTGLGLVISKGIVEGLGGKMWLKSEGKDKGTTIYFSIPKS